MIGSRRIGVFWLLVCSLWPIAEVVGQQKELIKVLIVDGFSNHDWQQTTKVTQWILERSGMFQVEVSTIPTDSVERTRWLPDFGQYDVVIQNTNNIWAQHLRWPQQVEVAFEEYVANGGGLYILHSANNAFPKWEAYNEMIGLGWRGATEGYALEIDQDGKLIRHAPGQGEGTGHAERFNVLIQKYTEHPINRDFPQQWQTPHTEVYYFPRGPAENLTVLSFAYDSTGTQRQWPVEWTVKYGQGRVYNSSLGHLWHGEKYPPAYRCVGYQTTVIRATEWLATGQVTYPVPDDFPTATSLSLYSEDELTGSD